MTNSQPTSNEREQRLSKAALTKHSLRALINSGNMDELERRINSLLDSQATGSDEYLRGRREAIDENAAHWQQQVIAMRDKCASEVLLIKAEHVRKDISPHGNGIFDLIATRLRSLTLDQVQEKTMNVSMEDRNRIDMLVADWAKRDFVSTQKPHLSQLAQRIATLVTAIREEARRAAFKDCITELCIDCAEGDEPTFDAQAKWYYHDAGTSSAVGCSASKLRIRAAVLEAAEKGEQ